MSILSFPKYAANDDNPSPVWLEMLSNKNLDKAIKKCFPKDYWKFKGGFRERTRMNFKWFAMWESAFNEEDLRKRRDSFHVVQ